MINDDATGMSKRSKWVCFKCKTENSTVRTDCKQCGHEPTAGRRDHEDRRWHESHGENDND